MTLVNRSTSRRLETKKPRRRRYRPPGTRLPESKCASEDGDRQGLSRQIADVLTKLSGRLGPPGGSGEVSCETQRQRQPRLDFDHIDERTKALGDEPAPVRRP